MKTLLFILFCLPNAFATDFCEEGLSPEVTTLANSNFTNFSNSYYLYFEGKNLEDLQVLKNCLDYSVCGKNKESIVDDPANYRLHIWTKLSISQLNDLVRSCPIENLNSKLVVKENHQTGTPVSLGFIAPSSIDQKSLVTRANPAFFHDTSDETNKATLQKLGKLLKASKTKEAEDLVLNIWGIDLHGYTLTYGGVSDNYATTDHGKKQVRYGKAWLNDPCRFTRMIRHEAEHIAQIQRKRECKNDHNYNDHVMRERAAYMNDARFAQRICPDKNIKNFCLNKLKSDYLKYK